MMCVDDDTTRVLVEMVHQLLSVHQQRAYTANLYTRQSTATADTWIIPLPADEVFKANGCNLAHLDGH